MCNREELTEINKKKQRKCATYSKEKSKKQNNFLQLCDCTDHAQNITARHKKITWCFEKALPMYITDLK